MSLLDSQTHASKLRTVAIARHVWPGIDHIPIGDCARRLLDVDEVLAGHGTPNLSQKDRERIEEAAKRFPEEA